MADETNKGMKMHIEFIERLSALMVAAFGLVAALAWNTAIQGIFTHFFGTAGTLTAQIGYAVLVTVIAVYVTYMIGRMKTSLTTKMGGRESRRK
ncbi:MAG TPA: DUF5654 family protein [Candidatus Baltobacteraceae bacterium]|nr:DUF5654 family protein [Candidatus Baltobacteraceae bacterium]